MSGLGACGHLLVAEPDGRVEMVEFTGRAPLHFDPEAYRPDPEGSTTLPRHAGQRSLEQSLSAPSPPSS